jgi:hypothetical protein
VHRAVAFTDQARSGAVQEYAAALGVHRENGITEALQDFVEPSRLDGSGEVWHVASRHDASGGSGGMANGNTRKLQDRTSQCYCAPPPQP